MEQCYGTKTKIWFLTFALFFLVMEKYLLVWLKEKSEGFYFPVFTSTHTHTHKMVSVKQSFITKY